MTTSLFTDLARCARDRALLAGADSMLAEEQAQEAFGDTLEPDAGAAERQVLIQRCQRWSSTRARYWRELAAAAALGGHRWPEAERLGGQP